MDDKEVDYTRCSLEELYDVQRRIDRTAYPERARRVEDQIARTLVEAPAADSPPPFRMRLEMPFFLELIMGCAAAAAAWSPWAVICAALNKGTFTVDGQRVHGPVFLRDFWWLLVLPGIAGAIVAYALRRERPWARETIVFAWLLIIAGLFTYNLVVNTMSTALGAATNPMIGLVLSCGYLYGKRSVQHYYSALERVSQSPSNPV